MLRVPLGDTIRSSQGGLVLNIFGVLVTWNTPAGLDTSELKTICDKEYSDDEVALRIKDSGMHKNMFDTWAKHTQHLAAVHKIPAWALSLELSCNAQERGRVHFHTYLGQRPEWSLVDPTSEPCCVRLKDLEYQGIKPNVQTMRPRGRRGVPLLASGGLYYVLCDKRGSIYRKGSVIPHQASRWITASCLFRRFVILLRLIDVASGSEARVGGSGAFPPKIPIGKTVILG